MHTLGATKSYKERVSVMIEMSNHWRVSKCWLRCNEKLTENLAIRLMLVMEGERVMFSTQAHVRIRLFNGDVVAAFACVRVSNFPLFVV
jgi:hypothetical protein